MIIKVMLAGTFLATSALLSWADDPASQPGVPYAGKQRTGYEIPGLPEYELVNGRVVQYSNRNGVAPNPATKLPALFETSRRESGGSTP